MSGTITTNSKRRPLRLARVVLMAQDGTYIWEGTLTQFFRDNRSLREEAAEIVAMLRPQEDSGRPEPAYIGGGAAQGFRLLLLDPPLPGANVVPFERSPGQMAVASLDLLTSLLRYIKRTPYEVVIDSKERLWA